MAIKIRDKATKKFPSNSVLEATIAQELPYFAKFLIDWKIPKAIEGSGRFGVAGYIDPSIAEAAYDNSHRSAIAELVEFFAKRCREAYEGQTEWKGTLTEFQVVLHDLNSGRSVGMSNNLEFVRRGMSTLEEAGKVNQKIRPIRSIGHGGGKIWNISLEEKFDIDA